MFPRRRPDVEGWSVSQREVLGSLVLLEQILIASVMVTLHPCSPALPIVTRLLPECYWFTGSDSRIAVLAANPPARCEFSRQLPSVVEDGPNWTLLGRARLFNVRAGLFFHIQLIWVKSRGVHGSRA